MTKLQEQMEAASRCGQERVNGLTLGPGGCLYTVKFVSDGANECNKDSMGERLVVKMPAPITRIDRGVMTVAPLTAAGEVPWIGAATFCAAGMGGGRKKKVQGATACEARRVSLGACLAESHDGCHRVLQSSSVVR